MHNNSPPQYWVLPGQRNLQLQEREYKEKQATSWEKNFYGSSHQRKRNNCILICIAFVNYTENLAGYLRRVRCTICKAHEEYLKVKRGQLPLKIADNINIVVSHASKWFGEKIKPI